MLLNPITDVILGSIAASASDLTSNPLVLLLIGSIIGSISPLLMVYITNKQQLKRDQLAHKQQLEREQEAHRRELRGAKLERRRAAYKVILNAAEEYKAVIQQLNFIVEGQTEETRNKHLNASLYKALEGMNEAMIEITLEGVEEEVKTTFSDMRLAFNNFTSKLSYNAQQHGSFTWEEITKHQDTVHEKVLELTASMKRHLKELEH